MSFEPELLLHHAILSIFIISEHTVLSIPQWTPNQLRLNAVYRAVIMTQWMYSTLLCGLFTSHGLIDLHVRGSKLSSA